MCLYDTLFIVLAPMALAQDSSLVIDSQHSLGAINTFVCD